jgi:hypothetical protein
MSGMTCTRQSKSPKVIYVGGRLTLVLINYTLKGEWFWEKGVVVPVYIIMPNFPSK